MTTWLLDDVLDVQVPVGKHDDDWEKEAWETDDEPDWADDDDDDDDWEDDDDVDDDDGDDDDDFDDDDGDDNE